MNRTPAMSTPAGLPRPSYARQATSTSAREEVLQYDWTPEAYLEYKIAYDERSLLDFLAEDRRAELERNARVRLSQLRPRDFRWHAPVVFARAEKPRDL